MVVTLRGGSLSLPVDHAPNCPIYRISSRFQTITSPSKDMWDLVDCESSIDCFLSSTSSHLLSLQLEEKGERNVKTITLSFRQIPLVEVEFLARERPELSLLSKFTFLARQRTKGFIGVWSGEELASLQELKTSEGNHQGYWPSRKGWLQKSTAPVKVQVKRRLPKRSSTECPVAKPFSFSCLVTKPGRVWSS